MFQDFSLLANSISDNITQSLPVVPETLNEVTEKAGIYEKIMSLPNQFDTNLGREIHEDGITLSGGQTQRLMLARALYKNAPIIVLDEPTAALDPLAENEMYQKYNDLIGGRTSIYISHRLASTRFCDRIILLENGVIAETGTHDQLISAGGKYAALFEIQSQYYQEEEQKWAINWLLNKL